MTTETENELKECLKTLEGGWAKVKDLPEKIKLLENVPDLLKQQEGTITKLRQDLDEHRKSVIKSRLNGSGIIRPKGRLSEKAAEQLGAQFVLLLERKGKLIDVIVDESARKNLLNETRGIFGLHTTEKVLSTSDIPLPVQYFAEIRDLIAEYGVVRNQMTPWPLSGGTDKPPRQKTRFALTSVAMAAQIAAKTVQVEFASLESHKLAGLIQTPREIREQSIVALGQYIARLAAVAAAQVEDEWGFLADGSGTYESVSGVAKIASDNSKLVQLASTKTATADATVANFRSIFSKVNSRILATGRWYLHATWRAYLPELNTQANQYTYTENGGEPRLFGYPITFTEVLAPYSASANPSAYFAAFGDLSYWWFGTRPGGLRIDESSDFAFDYDLITTRIMEEIDFDYMAVEAVAVMQTAAS